MLQDIRFGLRLLRRTPILTGATILTLALGIGLDAGVFNLIDGMLFRARVEHDPDTFVQIGVEYAGTKAPRAAGLPFVSVQDYNAFRSAARSLRGLAAWSPAGVSVDTASGATAHHVALLVTCNFFQVYGPERPLAGRLFRPDECSADDPSPVAVIGEDLWRTQYGSDPNIIGATLLLDRRPMTIVGVMPSGYAGQLRGPIWVPFTLEPRVFGGPDLVRGPLPWLVMVGRLADGITRERAAAELTLIASQQDRYVAGRTTVVQLTNGSLVELPDMRGMVFWIVPLIMGSLSLVLLLACGNVTMLLLSRAAARRHEIAVRLSLGASRWQLLRMLIAESVMLAAIASAPAIGLAYALPRAVRASIPSMPFYPFRIDVGVAVYLAAVTLLAGVLASIAPAFESLRQDVSRTLQNHDAPIGGRSGVRTRDILVGAQVAICLVLLVGAGLFARSEYQLMTAAPGYEADRVLLVVPRIALARGAPDAAASLSEALRDRIETIGGVRSVAFASAPPLVRDEMGGTDIAVHVRSAGPEASVMAARNVVSPEFFSTLAIPIARGRIFQVSESAGGIRPVVVSESLARALEVAANPIGALIEIGAGGEVRQIVGVAADIRSFAGHTSGDRILYDARPPRTAGDALLVRFAGDARNTAAAIRDVAASLGPDITVEPRTLKEIRAELAMKFVRIVRMVLLLGIVAVILAVIGIYAVVAFAVSRRTREMGIRSALGASRRDIVRLVLTSSVKPVAVGVAIGIVVAAFASQALAQVFRNAPVAIDSRDPLAYLAVTALLAVVAVAAMLRPAWRAAAADPIHALRRD